MPIDSDMAESYIRHILNAYMNVMTPLKAARRKQRLTQKTLAAAAGVTQAHISAVENGVDRASAELAERLVAALGRHSITEEEILYPDRFASQAKRP